MPSWRSSHGDADSCLDENGWRLAIPRRRGLPRPPSGLARFRVRSGVSGTWRVATSCSRSQFRRAHPARHPKLFEFRSAVERRAILRRGVRSRSGYGSALCDSGPSDGRQHDRVVVSLDLRRCLEAPGSGKASPPVPAPTGSCRTRRCWALRSPARAEPRILLRPTPEYGITLRSSQTGDQVEIQPFSSRARAARPRAAMRQKRSSGTAKGAASSSAGNHAVRKRSPYVPW